MSDAIARIDPSVLSKALRDVEGVRLDLSTEEGAHQASEIVGRLLGSPESEAQLLAAIGKYADPMLEAGEPLPTRYDAIKTTSPRVSSDPAALAPPIGSAEFDTYVDSSSADASEAGLADLQVATPKDLGFEGDEGAAPPSTALVEGILRTAQRELEALDLEKQRHSHSFLSRWLKKKRPEPGTFARVVARNRFTVLVSIDNARMVSWDHVTSGGFLYLKLMKRGKLAFRGKVPLADKAAVNQRLADVFADEPSVGAATLHAVRLAMSQAAQPHS